MIRTQIQIHETQLKWLKQQTVEKGVSMAHLIRESIALYQEHIERTNKIHSQRHNALKAVGTFSSKEEGR